MSPDVRFVAVAGRLSGIEMFSINADPNASIPVGMLSSLGQPTATQGWVASLEFDSSGSFLYVGLETSGIQTFEVGAHGVLATQGVIPSGSGTLDMAMRLTVR